jgi:3-polyprenyl-4-hydroxybenzoate decarboxylase
MPNVPHLVDESAGVAINLPVVNCLTSDVRVPAAAEIMIEGRILPGARELEGPFNNVIVGAFCSHYDIKQVVVDDGVDVHNPTEVEWAVATNLEAEFDASARPDWAKILAE